MATKSQKITLIILGCSYLIFVISTFAGVDFLIELFSAITATLTGTLILFCMKEMNEFYVSFLALSVGVYCWAVADVIRFMNHYCTGGNPLNIVVRTLYLLPNYFFGIALAVYIVKKLKGRRRELSYLVANAFCISGIGFVLIQKLLYHISNGRNIEFATELRALMYFFINFFIIFVVAHLLRLVGYDNIGRGTNLIPLGILCYIIFDFQYTYQEAVGEEPENIFTNLVYMFFMIIIAVGTLFQNNRKYVYFFGVTDFSSKAIRKRVLYILIAFAVNIIALFIGFLTLNEALYIVILLMAYMIMTYISRTDMLNESLLEQQMQQTEMLEEKVNEKTKELKEANEYLEKLSSTDLLTGLYNRRYGYNYLEKLHDESEKHNKKYAVFCLDLNGFKPINDTYGHEMGDRVLKEFGDRMLELPERYIAIRTGGDEFMLIMKRDESEYTIEQEAFNIREIFHKPMHMDTYEFRLSASIGVACYPEDAHNVTTLIQYADEAMYIIKHSENKDGYKIFESSLIADVIRNEEIKKRIEKADPDKEFVLRYQPQYDVVENKLIGVEVFPHLNDEHDDVSPSILVPLAEELGIMNTLGMWITRTAMNQVSEWNQSLDRELMITINLSPLQIIDNDYIDFLEHIGEEYGISPAMVTLDVNNEVIMGSVESAKATLIRLRKQGFNLSLNNFGGGDINLSYVQECGFDGLKLSRTLISNVIEEPGTIKLIQSITAIADSMNMEVTAVGIENAEQVKQIKDLGIVLMQGYYFGKPVVAEEFKYDC